MKAKKNFFNLCRLVFCLLLCMIISCFCTETLSANVVTEVEPGEYEPLMDGTYQPYAMELNLTEAKAGVVFSEHILGEDFIVTYAVPRVNRYLQLELDRHEMLLLLVTVRELGDQEYDELANWDARLYCYRKDDPEIQHLLVSFYDCRPLAQDGLRTCLNVYTDGESEVFTMRLIDWDRQKKTHSDYVLFYDLLDVNGQRYFTEPAEAWTIMFGKNYFVCYDQAVFDEMVTYMDTAKSIG